MANINDLLTTLAKRLRPLMVAVSEATLTAGEGPGIDIAGSNIGLGGDTILLYKSDGDPVAEYAATDAGLDLASAAVASSEEIICVPANASLTANHMLVGCTYIFPPRMLVTGVIMCVDNSVVVGLYQIVTGNSGSMISGVVGPESGEAELYDCWIAPVNNGAGGVAAVSVSNSGNLICHNCYLDGRGALGGGSGYAGYHDGAGDLRIEGGTSLGSSADDPFNE